MGDVLAFPVPDGTDPSGSGAVESELPRQVQPQLAKTAKRPPPGDDWLHELKYDGHRLLLTVEDGVSRLTSRSGNDATEKWPTVERAASELPGTAILDGEVVVLDRKGRPDFGALQAAQKDASRRDIYLYAWDLLYLNGWDLRPAPLEERKRLLKAYLNDAPIWIRYADHVAQGAELLAYAEQLQLEGIVSKRRSARYVGKRGSSWLKIKVTQRQEFIVVGWTDSDSENPFASLALAVTVDGGSMSYVGRVGTGFNERQRETLYGVLKQLGTEVCPVENPPQKIVHWIEPRLVAEIEFSNWTADGVLRFPAFKGLRFDKPVSEVVAEGR